MQQHTLSDALTRYQFEVNIAPPQQSVCNRLSQSHGAIAIANVTEPWIKVWIVQRVSEAAIATVHRELSVLSQVFNSARAWGWIKANPYVGIKRPKGVAMRERWLTQDEENQLIAASPKWLANVITFALQTGMRRGELLSLTWSQILFQEGYILIHRSKNGDRRGIPISHALEDLLQTISRSYPVDRPGPVLTKENGSAISNNDLEYAFRLAITRANLPGLHFHDTRHTYATRLIQRGADLYSVQRLLGHRNPAMTQRYAHHSVESLRAVVQLLHSPPPASTEPGR